MKKLEPSLVGKTMNQLRKDKKLRASETHDKSTSRRKLPVLNCVLMKSSNVCPNVLKSFKCFTHTVAPLEKAIKVQSVSNPSRSGIVMREKPMSAKGSSMISAFATQISTMTIHVLHGKAQSVLNTNHRLTSKRQLHMSAGLDRAQADTSSMHGIIQKA